MRNVNELEATLAGIDGRGYKAYEAIGGAWSFVGFTLYVDHVQGDPFADPSRIRIQLEPHEAALPAASIRSKPRRLGVAAFLARSSAEVGRSVSRRRGTGKSGEVRAEHPGQIVVPQTAVQITDEGGVEARFGIGLPARGRRVAAREAMALLLEDVPSLIERSLLGAAHEGEVIERHASTNEDAEFLRAMLAENALVAFVADGARLPRRSGVDDRPLDSGTVIPFSSPESLRVEVELPNAGRVTGMGLPEGVTLIVGGGFHGKSTLLRALQDGVYNHGPGDGRERVVSRSDCVKIRAEDGRSVIAVDISPFIDGLPLDRDTQRFSTTNASGSTSQAAAIAEALEAGARVLLVDEDTSATNFMIRDRRMQELVPKSGEPITPFVDRVRDLYEEQRVSTVLVLGGSGDYLDVADRVIRMHEYTPEDVTEEAGRVAQELPTGRAAEIGIPVPEPAARVVDRASIDPTKGRRARAVKVPDDRTLLLGTEAIDLVAVEQLPRRAQVRAIGQALATIAESRAGGPVSVPELLDGIEATIGERGLDALCSGRFGDLAWFRRFELAAALNRLRSLRVV